MDMTKDDIKALANDVHSIRTMFSNSNSFSRYCYTKHYAMLRRVKDVLTKQWKKRLVLSANYFPRKACYPYGKDVMKKA